MTVSSATSQEVRRTKLSSLFINLISDPSRWVRDFPLPWATALRMFVCVDKWDYFSPLESGPGSFIYRLTGSCIHSNFSFSFYVNNF